MKSRTGAPSGRRSPRIEAHGRDRLGEALRAVRRGRRQVVQVVRREVVLDLRHDKVAGAVHAVRNVRIEDDPVAFRRIGRRDAEPRIVGFRAEVEAADVVLRVLHVQLRLAAVRRDRRRQRLPVLVAREHRPGAVVVRDTGFLLVQRLRAVDELVRRPEVFGIRVVRDLVVVDVAAEAAAEILLVLPVDRVAVAVREPVIRQVIGRKRARNTTATGSGTSPRPSRRAAR